MKSQELISIHPPQPKSVDELREALNAKLGELHRRAVHVKEVVTPATYVANPWLRIGLGLVAGAVVGDQARRGGLAGTLALLGLGAIVGRALTSHSERARDAASPAP